MLIANKLQGLQVRGHKAFPMSTSCYEQKDRDERESEYIPIPVASTFNLQPSLFY